KRRTYDSHGHQGLENLASGKSAGTGQSWADAAGPIKPMRTYSEEDTFSFFDKVAERNGYSSGVGDDNLTAEERRARAREARRNRRNRGNGDFMSSSQPEERPVQSPTAPQADFNVVSDDVKNATDKLRAANQNGVV